ncbi:MAG: type VI secretion system-associated protein TagO [Myxococcota bacterium]
MKRPAVVALSLAAVLAAGLFFRYGTLAPCGMLKKALRSQLLASTVSGTTGNRWELAGRGLALALGGPMVDSMVDSLTPAQCVRALYRVEVGQEDLFADTQGTNPALELPYESESRPVEKSRWRSQTETSPLDDSTNVYLWIEADDSISGWLESNVRPTLNIRCKENTTNAYINLKMRPDTEYGSYGSQYAYVTLRFDDDNAFQEKFGVSTDGEAVFFPRHIGYVKQMLKHQKLLIRFTPANASPQLTTFNLEGLEGHIAPLREACHW